MPGTSRSNAKDVTAISAWPESNRESWFTLAPVVLRGIGNGARKYVVSSEADSSSWDPRRG